MLLIRIRKNTSLIIIRGIILLLLTSLSQASLSQDTNLRSITTKYVIKNATIVQTPEKTIPKGSILIEKGIIKAVGSNISIPSDAWVIDADSMFVYAGFISGLSNIGIEKSKEEKPKDDRKLTGTPTYKRAGITPNNSARSMLDAKEKSIKTFRKLGFTASHSVPHQGMLPGTGAFILLGGLSSEQMIVKDKITMHAQFESANGVYPNTVIGVMAKYRDLYKKSKQAYAYAQKYKNNPNGMERPSSDAQLEALYPVVSKKMPVAFKTESIKDIMRAITLQKELGFPIIFGEIKQGWDAIPAIKSIGAPIFLSLDLPKWKEEEKKKEKETDEKKTEEKEATKKGLSERESEEKALKIRQMKIIKKYYTQASQFQANQIDFGFSTMEVKSKDFKTNLLKIMENGLTDSQILAALTTTPARILGFSDIMGTIEVGKMANFFISDTSYFTKKANIKYVFVDGMKYEYETKKKKGSESKEVVNAVGIWNYSTETPQGKGSGDITISGTLGDYKGTITVNFNNSTNDLENIVVEGNKISFSFKTNIGEDVVVEISMEIEGDTFEGTLSVANFGSFPMEGSREPK